MSKRKKHFDLIVVGAGAAGLICAMEAGKRGRKVLLLEHNHSPGEKIRISGGGRCNFTNLYTSPENYISQNPHFCKSALARFTPYDFIELLEAAEIAFHEKALGQLFCDYSAKQIIRMLVEHCQANKVDLVTDCKVLNVKKPLSFLVETSMGVFESDSLVIASGGLSIPKMGATGFGYRIARQFGLKIIDCHPGLVPLTMGADFRFFQSLRGVSFEGVVDVGRASFRESILFTHKGLSGPAILQASSYWKQEDSLFIDLLPDFDFASMWSEPMFEKKFLANVLSQEIPKRFSHQFCDMFFDPKPVGKYEEKQKSEVENLLHRWEIKPSGTEGYRKAEVTVGGVDTTQLSSKTMESRDVKGLYFIGEVVDVTGWLGGYNFQWAWSSGHAAGTFA